MIAKTKVTSLLAIIAFASALHAQTVVMFRGAAPLSGEAAEIERLVESSGVNLQLVNAGTSAPTAHEIARLSHEKVLAVLLAADALDTLSPDIQTRLRTPDGKPAPVMIFDVDAATSQRRLQLWSEGALQGCIAVEANKQAETLHVFAAAPWTGTLSGMDLPAVDTPACKLKFEGAGPKVVLENASAGSKSPALLEVSTKRGELLVVPRRQPFDRSWIGQPWGTTRAFSSMAPFLLFLKQALADYGWHLDGHYANLTIDDPWLTEPYGYLNYHRLLAEMEKHRFHTTIAFVPWNYDRSDLGVAALFRANPDYFSICLHGNNHIHREFGEYAGKPLAGQVADIRQGLARMEEFQRLTGIAYDRFMVFPHGVAPDATFAALKTYGFLGTANSLNVPLDQATPPDPLFLLRPYTTEYGDLLSFSRFSVEAPISPVEMAIETFMGNPVLFYAHQGYFANGITAFDGTADALNHLQPDTRWVGLGDLARHSYEIRRRDDGAFDVRMFSNQMTLTNRTLQDATYFVSAKLPPATSQRQLTINGVQTEFQSIGDTAHFQIRLRPKESSVATMTWSVGWDEHHQSIRKTEVRSYLLRHISDLRDMRLSQQNWSRSLVGYYYAHRGESLELYLERSWRAITLLVGLIFVLLPAWRRYKRRLVEQRGSAVTSIL